MPSNARSSSSRDRASCSTDSAPMARTQVCLPQPYSSGTFIFIARGRGLLHSNLTTAMFCAHGGRGGERWGGVAWGGGGRTLDNYSRSLQRLKLHTVLISCQLPLQFMGLFLLSMEHCNRQTDRQTDRQTQRCTLYRPLGTSTHRGRGHPKSD